MSVPSLEDLLAKGSGHKKKPAEIMDGEEQYVNNCMILLYDIICIYIYIHMGRTMVSATFALQASSNSGIWGSYSHQIE